MFIYFGKLRVPLSFLSSHKHIPVYLHQNEFTVSHDRKCIKNFVYERNENHIIFKVPVEICVKWQQVNFDIIESIMISVNCI